MLYLLAVKYLGSIDPGIAHGDAEIAIHIPVARCMTDENRAILLGKFILFCSLIIRQVCIVNGVVTSDGCHTPLPEERDGVDSFDLDIGKSVVVVLVNCWIQAWMNYFDDGL